MCDSKLDGDSHIPLHEGSDLEGMGEEGKAGRTSLRSGMHIEKPPEPRAPNTAFGSAASFPRTCHEEGTVNFLTKHSFDVRVMDADTGR